ncbi:MAG: prepilin-type N-terminal cleavage/methylation domain-containing protein [Phycisphaerae bacterium]|nr:prepilin-type N-terminal cleavage/methylation domain-containing protein [Phycisphaerae bacterium]
MLRQRPNRTRGFTLAEALLAAAVLAITVGAVTLPFSAAARNGRVQARRSLATALAEELMEEVLAKPFLDPDEPGAPGPDAGEAGREDFDNIDDYHGYAESDGDVVWSTGDAVTDDAADGLSRTVAAEYVYVTGQDMGQDPTFIRVTVSVDWRDETTVTLTRLVHSLEGGYNADGDDGAGPGDDDDEDEDDEEDDDEDEDDEDDDGDGGPPWGGPPPARPWR